MKERNHLIGASAVAACAALALAVPARSATVTVTGTGDTIAVDGSVTLREAIASMNAGANVNADVVAVGAYGTSDTIAFAIAGVGVKTITPASALPTISVGVLIDGYTQSGASANTNPMSGAINAVLLVEVNGTGTSGLLTIAGAGTTVRGLVLNRSQDNILVMASGVTIAGTFIGTDPSGSVAMPAAAGGFGIRIANIVANNVTVGGAAAADRNLIAGDKQGGVIAGTNTGLVIQGNFIGTNAAGTGALGQPLAGGLFNVSNASVTGNLISGNPRGAIFLTSPGNVVIQGNLIGTQRDGVTALPNGNVGISVAGNDSLVGGAGIGEPNVVAFTNDGGSGPGIAVQSLTSGNRISRNSIHDNFNLGITLRSSSPGVPLPNDACDIDPLSANQGNRGQNYPVLTTASIVTGDVTISGTLNSKAVTTYRVEFFSNVACHAAGNGEGQTFLGFVDVTTDAACNASFTSPGFAIPPGQTFVTATATDPLGNTSEFSVCLSAAAGPTPTPTVTPTVTPTTTPTTTTTPTVTPTPQPGGPAVPSNVPALSDAMLAFLGIALVGAALMLLKRGA